MTAPDDRMQQLISALAYAQSAQVMMDALSAMPDVAAEGIKLLFTIPQVRALVRIHPQAGAHAVVQATYRLNLMRRAAYLTAAAHRMSTAAQRGPTDQARALVVERRYLQQHLAADAGRMASARVVAATARQLYKRAQRGEAGFTWNGLLGWYAVMDEQTSAECRKANGRNFDPTQIPPIGLPGTVHPHCRCRPGPPFPGSEGGALGYYRVEDIRPERPPTGADTGWRVTVRP